MTAKRPLVIASGIVQELPSADHLLIPTAAAFAAEYDNGNSGTSATINFANGNKQKITLNNNTTLTISTPPGVGEYKLRLIQDGTGGRTVAFSGISSSRWWGSAAQPDFNDAVNGETLLAFYYDGTNFSQGAAKIGAV
jgi:hypothetical protein